MIRRSSSLFLDTNIWHQFMTTSTKMSQEKTKKGDFLIIYLLSMTGHSIFVWYMTVKESVWLLLIHKIIGVQTWGGNTDTSSRREVEDKKKNRSREIKQNWRIRRKLKTEKENKTELTPEWEQKKKKDVIRMKDAKERRRGGIRKRGDSVAGWEWIFFNTIGEKLKWKENKRPRKRRSFWYRHTHTDR